MLYTLRFRGACTASSNQKVRGVGRIKAPRLLLVKALDGTSINSYSYLIMGVGRREHITDRSIAAACGLKCSSSGHQTQSDHDLFDGLQITVQQDSAQDTFDSSCHEVERDIATLRRVRIDKGVDTMKSTNAVQVPIGSHFQPNLIKTA